MEKYIVKHDIQNLHVLEYIEALELSHITGKPLWYAILEKLGKRKQTQTLVEQAVNGVKYDSTVESFRRKRMFPILRLVGKKYMTYEVCKEAVSHNGFNLKFCPKEYLTKEICTLALSDNGGCLLYIPEDMRTYDLCDMAVTHDVYYGNAIESVPSSIIKSNPNNGWYKKAIIATANAIQFIPDNEITDDIIHVMLAHILNDVSNDDYFDEVAIAKDICTIPRKYITEAFLNEFIKNKPECAKHLLIAQNLSTEHQQLCGEETKMLVLNDRSGSQEDRFGGTKTDINHCVYYISDIHLEHQLALSKSKSFNCEELRRRLCVMLEPVMQYPGMCLFGGDIADSAELESVFFYEAMKIANNSKCELIVVLGNHELWNGNPFLNVRFENIDAVIDTYRETIPRQVVLLQNAMYIKYGKFKIPIVLEEQALLNISSDDLQIICRNSTDIIFGGIGFSEFETRFNGAHGLYGMLVDGKEDIKQTERFRKLYEKLLSAANDIPIIVLTHTPITYWTNAKPNPKWVYISGHTHQNKVLCKNVFCDNQVGYQPKRWTLKSLNTESLFEKQNYILTNGIHKVSSKEYHDLVFQRGLSIPSLNFDGDIFAIKWQEYFMFVVQKKSNLYLLDGGKQLKMQNDVSYYLYWLPTYISNISSTYKNYWYIISKISKEIKYIGGNGTIHGCIVDIDTYHHVYWNPLDGTITPYFALSTTNKVTYSNLEQLIKNTPCQKVRSYQDSKTIIELYEQATAENKIPTLMNGMSATIKSATFVAGTYMYRPSEYFRKLQYFFENKIIRSWDDRILFPHKKES